MRRYARIKSAAILCIAAASFVAGCKKQEEKPPVVNSPATRPASRPAATRPSTESLLNGPRKSIILGGLPLRMMVPQSWKIVGTSPPQAGSSDETSDLNLGPKTPSSLGPIWLAGPTPNGSVRIQLMSNSAVIFKGETLTYRNKKAMKDAAASGGKLQVIPLHPLGVAAQMMERREITRQKRPGFDGEPQPVAVMDWSVEVYVPQDKDYSLDLLHFSPIPLEQYKTDKSFLENILSTLHYDAAMGALQ